MIDTSFIGRVLPAHTVEVEKGRLCLFAKAIGERNPVYTDESAARAAGYRSLPVPPTFLFSLDNEVPDPFAWLTGMGVDLRRILHGEQSFVYSAPACAGDTLTFASRIAGIYAKKGGALEFFIKETTVTEAAGAVVAELRSVIVVRNA